MGYELDKVIFFRSIDTKDFETLDKLLNKHPRLIYEDDDDMFSVASYCILKCFDCLLFIFNFYNNNKDKFKLKFNFLNVHNADMSTALHLAVELQDKKAIEFLAMNGIDINKQKFTGDTALNELTLYSNNIELAKILLVHGADPNIANNFNISALRRALTTDKIDFLKLYLRYGGVLNGFKQHLNGRLITDKWLETILETSSDDIKLLIQNWIKQQKRKKSSLSKRSRTKYRQKDLEKQYIKLCEKTRELPIKYLHKFAKQQKIDITDKSKEQICDELSTKLLIKRSLLFT